MNKNLYSLVLSKDVVDEIDRLAYSMHTNRSNMINQILAEYVSYVTPEKRIKQIYDSLNSIISESAVFQALAGSGSVFRLRSAIAYKYTPMVNYSLEIYKKPTREFGALKVSVRTQNEALWICLISFFELWSELERSYAGASDTAVSDGKFIKKLCSDRLDNDPERLAAGIFGYIDCFDKAMKSYINLSHDPAEAASEAGRIYLSYIRNSTFKL